jgi:hypothetical protein
LLRSILNRVKAQVELEKAIKKIKDPVAKKWVESVIDKEGFDYAFEGYDTFESVWNFDTKKRQKFKDANFHKARKKYLSTRKAVLRSILGANYNEDMYGHGGGVPQGYHRMPDGTIMADSEHYAKKAVKLTFISTFGK